MHAVPPFCIIRYMAKFEEAYLPKTEPDKESLLSFGFLPCGDVYVYKTEILDGAFRLKIEVRGQDVRTSLVEAETLEPYEVYRVEAAHGDYVGLVREAIKEVLLAIRKSCYASDWTKRRQVSALLAYVKEAFQGELEYPWSDDNAVIRRKDNRKWYCLFMPLPVSKLGLEEDRVEVVMNILRDGETADMKTIFPAYHMNKKSWVSIILDGLVPNDVLFRYVAESYEKAGKGKKR